MDSKGTQPYTYMYPFSPKLPSHPGCHIALSRVACALQQVLVIHLKYSSAYMTIPAPHLSFPSSFSLATISLFSKSLRLTLKWGNTRLGDSYDYLNNRSGSIQNTQSRDRHTHRHTHTQSRDRHTHTRRSSDTQTQHSHSGWNMLSMVGEKRGMGNQKPCTNQA